MPEKEHVSKKMKLKTEQVSPIITNVKKSDSDEKQTNDSIGSYTEKVGNYIVTSCASGSGKSDSDISDVNYLEELNKISQNISYSNDISDAGMNSSITIIIKGNVIFKFKYITFLTAFFHGL